MNLPELAAKLVANAVAVTAGYWTVNYFQIAEPSMFLMFWFGMVAAHITYLGHTKEKT